MLSTFKQNTKHIQYIGNYQPYAVSLRALVGSVHYSLHVCGCWEVLNCICTCWLIVLKQQNQERERKIFFCLLKMEVWEGEAVYPELHRKLRTRTWPDSRREIGAPSLCSFVLWGHESTYSSFRQSLVTVQDNWLSLWVQGRASLACCPYGWGDLVNSSGQAGACKSQCIIY